MLCYLYNTHAKLYTTVRINVVLKEKCRCGYCAMKRKNDVIDCKWCTANGSKFSNSTKTIQPFG